MIDEYKIELCDILLLNVEPEVDRQFSLALTHEEEKFKISSCTGFEAALKILKTGKTDLVVFDPFYLDSSSGQIKLLLKIKKLFPAIKILIVSDSYDEEKIFQTFKHGASGYILYQSGLQVFLKAVAEVMIGGAPMSREVASRLVTSYQVCHTTPLTHRERDVLREISSGKAYKYIAHELNVTVDTIRTHAQHIFEKLEVHNKSEAVIKAKLKRLV